jgi:formate dehydrogenase iron-sulfur subunit
MSVGMFCVAQLLRMLSTEATPLIVVAAAIGFAGQLAAIFHLGRPTIAWKAWLGWRTSWLSREVIAFGAFSVLATASVLTTLGVLPGEYSVLSTQYEVRNIGSIDLATIASLSLLGTCLIGIAAVVCSAMVYVATQREYWSASRTVPRFLLTALLLGFAGGLAIEALFAGESPSPWCYGALAGLTLIRLWHDSAILRLPVVSDDSPLGRAVALITGPLDGWHVTQLVAAILGGGILPLLALTIPNWPLSFVFFSCVLLLAAEFIQRWLFFAAAAPPRMPGVSHS